MACAAACAEDAAAGAISRNRILEARLQSVLIARTAGRAKVHRPT